VPFFDDREVLIGKYKHAAYKTCYWTEQKLRTGGRRGCYKTPFGINSHLCMQSTSFRGCNLGCVFCWRNVEERQHSHPLLDEPETIADGIIGQQTLMVKESLPRCVENYHNMAKILVCCKTAGGSATIAQLSDASGISRVKVKEALYDLKNGQVVKMQGNLCVLERSAFDSIHEESDAVKTVEARVASLKDIIRVHEEAIRPKHVAISYDGEPTMYRRIPDLVSEFRKRGISTFLVTNGTFPERIKEMRETCSLPTQLYVTVAAPDRETYLKVALPSSHFSQHQLSIGKGYTRRWECSENCSVAR
jgi:wyosine [tRNA(Phe)-imidazoG37] synthetase (radical SAM superfamily)